MLGSHKPRRGRPGDIDSGTRLRAEKLLSTSQRSLDGEEQGTSGQRPLCHVEGILHPDNEYEAAVISHPLRFFIHCAGGRFHSFMLRMALEIDEKGQNEHHILPIRKNSIIMAGHHNPHRRLLAIRPMVVSWKNMIKKITA